MIRNDYRRALIMLRALEKGYSGHVQMCIRDRDLLEQKSAQGERVSVLAWRI